MQVTAKRTKELHEQTLAAFVAVNKGKAQVGKLIKDRDIKAQLVRKDLRALYAELKLSLDPMDYLFEKFGFKRPGLV